MSVFVDVENKQPESQAVSGSQETNVGSMAIGNGSRVMRADQSGLWLGASKWADAPFRVDMQGNVVATSADFSSAGYTKINVFKQDDIPTSVSAGDIWFDTNDNNKIYRAAAAGANEVKAGEWEAVQDGDIAIAQATADGKNVTYYQNTEPTTAVEGDLWVNTAYEDSNTKLLLHFDGVDGDVATTDHASGKVITFAGNAQIDTAQYKYGGSSLLLDGVSDYLTAPDSADWNFADGDFTIDCYVRFADPVTTGQICGQWADADNRWLFYYNGASNILRLYVEVANTAIIDIQNSWTPVHSTWYHVALVRTGDDFKMFVNGVQIGTTQTDTSDMPDIASVLYIGSQNTTSTEWVGWLDELRIVKGVAKWTSNFSPLTAPHGLSNETNRLYRYNGTNWVIVRDTSISDAILKSGVSQVFSGDFILKDRNVKIDGANARILISDGTDDRILIGYQSGGF